MIIEIKKNIVWDTEVQRQTDETVKWFHETVLPLVEICTPEFDEFKRPYMWVVNVDGVVITIKRDYIHKSYSWAMNSDIITIQKL